MSQQRKNNVKNQQLSCFGRCVRHVHYSLMYPVHLSAQHSYHSVVTASRTMAVRLLWYEY